MTHGRNKMTSSCNGDGTWCGACTGSESRHRASADAISFCVRNFLLLGLSLALIIGLALPAPGVTCSSWKIESSTVGTWPILITALVVCMFMIHGISLKMDDLKNAVRNWFAIVYSLTSILLITPWIGLAPLKIGYVDPGLAAGFAVFYSMPTTLTSGINLVNQCNGNTAFALIITVCSNFLGILTVPFVVSAMLQVGGINLSPWPLLGKLCITIIVPLLFGTFLRDRCSIVSSFAKRHKMALSLLQQSFVVFIAWMKLSDASAHVLSTASERPVDFLLVLVTGAAFHGIYLTFNTFCSQVIMRLAIPEKRAVILLCSQKTFPVAVTVISFLDPAQVGDTGLLLIPCVMGHFTQLFWDATLVTRWMKGDACAAPAPALAPTAVDAA